MTRTAVFPGSFDPIHLGHVEIIRKAELLFDKIIIGIGNNSQKQYLFSIEKRKEWITKVFNTNSAIEVMTYSGLTVDFCKSVNAGFIIRGLRTSSDFEFEKAIAQMNQSMEPSIQSVFIPASPALSHVSSTIIREIIKYGGNVKQFLPEQISL